MIQPLRRAHGYTFVVLAVALATILLAGLGLRHSRPQLQSDAPALEKTP